MDLNESYKSLCCKDLSDLANHKKCRKIKQNYDNFLGV